MTADRGTVLVVDDDKMNRMMLGHNLAQEGYRAAMAEDGKQALEMLGSEPFDVVLLDVVMPGMDGFEVLKHIKDDAELRHVPVIMISGLDDLEGVVRCIEMGAEDFLPKPFDPVLLRARINAGLAKKRLHELEREYHAAVERHATELENLNAELSSRVEEQVSQLERLGRLRRFLSPQLAELIVSSGDDETLLNAHRRQISVLFCDLRGFTAFSETTAPEEVMRVLGQFHTMFGPLVRRFEATVGFFAGDGVMVFFNDPMPCSDPAAKAVQLAAALREEIAELLAGWLKQEYDLDFGIGITLGYATLGQVGFEGRYDYTPIGPVVNLASRLCDLARGAGDILLDQLAYSAVEDLVDVEPLGTFPLKGFSRPRSVYRLLSLHRPESEGLPGVGGQT